MTYRIGPKGQVVIPKPLRDRHGLRPGDEVRFSDDDVGIHIISLRDLAAEAKRLQAKYAGQPSLTAALEADRRAERD